MSERLNVTDNDNNPVYDIVIEKDFSNLLAELKAFNIENRKICIVSDSNVSKLYSEEIINLISENSKKAHLYTFPAGEENKNLDTVRNLYKFLIENEFERSDLLIALGGGVTGDLTGYAAATYLRGIDFIQIPTTLLAQSDSSVGGKTGVDFDGYKNMVGAFYQPILVYINVSTLNTLTEREYLSGMGEVIKHGIIKNRDFYFWLKDNHSLIINRDLDTLLYMTKMNCSIKRDVVQRDFKESGERALLNLGHTLGHAIEKFVFADMLHGECVSLGIVGAAYISMKKSLISENDYNDIINTLTLFKLPICENRIDTDDVIKATFSDKKMEAGKIKFIVIKSIGEAIIDKTIDWVDMKEALDIIITGAEYKL
jgi:3-dehydroquinate synthase